MLDAGSTLVECLDAALLRARKLRRQDFERQPGDPAADRPIAVVHIEIHIVGREMVVPRVSRQWHGSLPSYPQSNRNTVLLLAIIMTDSQRQKLDYG
jgi:hypothetical protein